MPWKTIRDGFLGHLIRYQTGIAVVPWPKKCPFGCFSPKRVAPVRSPFNLMMESVFHSFSGCGNKTWAFLIPHGNDHLRLSYAILHLIETPGRWGASSGRTRSAGPWARSGGLGREAIVAWGNCWSNENEVVLHKQNGDQVTYKYIPGWWF